MEPHNTTVRSDGATARWRILHLEDNDDDRELVRVALAVEGIGCEIVYAGTRDEFVLALEREAFDLVLSDFTIPGFDGMAALALVREKFPEVPYLFVSGTIGEERAIDGLKHGANDYVLKDRLDRLVPAVQRALREAAERVERHAAEVALRQTEARYRSIFENAVEGIYLATPQGRLLEVNRTMAQLCGYVSPAELCAGVRDLAADVYLDRPRRAEFTRLLDERGHVLGHEAQIKRADGTIIWVSENARAVRDASGGLLHYEGLLTDITSRKQAEDALRKSEERFRVMAGSIDEVFWISDAGGPDPLYVSPAFERIWGRSVAELYAEPGRWFEAVVPEDKASVLASREQLKDGKEHRVEYRIRRPDGTLRWVEDRSYPITEPDRGANRAVGVAIDITRRKQLESQLLQSQKMEAIGQLAGGVAHDFNNVLTVVTGYARLLLDGGTMPPDAVEGLTQIYTAGARAASLTRQLLVFSCKRTANRQVIDLNLIVGEMVKMLRRLIGENIALKVELSRAAATIEADPGMMEQVLMNLAVNARDAMTNGGVLSIQTNALQIVDASSRHHPKARAGEFFVLSVHDTGCGIPPDNLARIFEPFFTTKEVGKGTGLGLATVFGIVEQHHGWIEVESTVGTGTCFRIVLPASHEEALVGGGRSTKLTHSQKGSETMLLVEDEPSVREFAAAVLSGCGYRVLQASSGIEALEIWKWHGSRIALLFSDLVLTDGLGGIELAATLRKEKPTLRVVLTSGYADETTDDGFRPPPGTHFIHKPYKPQVLTQAVRDALDDSFDR